MNNFYSIKKQDGEFIVAKRNGVIIAYCDTRAQAEDIRTAQQRDDERHDVMDAYNKEQELLAMRNLFVAEFY